MEEGRDVHKVLVGKPEGKRPLGRPRRSGRSEEDTSELQSILLYNLIVTFQVDYTVMCFLPWKISASG
jgi:hypothetical protein